MTFFIAACRGWIEQSHRLRMRSCSIVWRTALKQDLLCCPIVTWFVQYSLSRCSQIKILRQKAVVLTLFLSTGAARIDTMEVPRSCFNGCEYPFHTLGGKTLCQEKVLFSRPKKHQYIYMKSQAICLHLQSSSGDFTSRMPEVQNPRSKNQKATRKRLANESPRRKLRRETKTEDRPAETKRNKSATQGAHWDSWTKTTTNKRLNLWLDLNTN